MVIWRNVDHMKFININRSVTKMVVNENLIELNLEARNSEDVIKILGNAMKEEGYVKSSYLDAVIEREKIFPTGLPSEGICVAIPHTDTWHVNKSAFAVGILKEPVKFFMMGDESTILNIDIVLLLAIDNPTAQVEFLRKLMTVIQNQKLLLELKKSTSKAEVMKLLSYLND
jgi:galactitol PTS system EIIA component